MAPRTRSGTHPGRALAALAVLILIMLVSILGKDTFSPGSWHHRFKVGLGLDLSSGTQVVLQAQTPNGKAPSSGDMSQAISVLQSRVDGTGNTNALVQQQGSNLINVSLPGKGAQQTIALISSTARLRFRQVLYFQPYAGTTSPSSKASPPASPSGTATPAASPSGTASPAAGASPKASATATASTSAKVVRASASPAASATASASATPKASSSATPKASATPSPSASSSASSTAFGDASLVNAATMKLFDKLVCKPGPNSTTTNDSWKNTVGYTPAKSQWDEVNSQTVACDPSGDKYVLGTAVFTGQDVTQVSPQLQQSSTGWVVSITLNGKASKALATLSTNQANKDLPGASTNENDAVLDQMAVVLDGDVVVAPETQQALTSGNFEIDGGTGSPFTQQYATYLSNVIKYGQLPLNFTQQSVDSISPSLGHDSLVAGLIAGVIGLALVVIYLFCYYRGLGLVSVSSLLIAALLAYLAVVLLSLYQGFTMELAGIAGLVVAIGITADSFIVFFERLRDEVRDGKALRPAVESGWKRARRTVLVSDTVSFLAAVLLYQFATSEVRGFAYTLGLTTVIDVVVVFLFTKPMVTLLAGTRFYGGGHRWSGLDPARLGARSPWRGGVRRTQRTRPAATRATAGPPTSPSSTNPREA